MSEVKLNIIDSNGTVHGTTHGSVGEAIVAALSAEPETVAELEAALERFIKPLDNRKHFSSFRSGLDDEPWDAGIVIVDLAARIVAAESSYLSPEPVGKVLYHNGVEATEFWLPYRVPDDWLFVGSVAHYYAICEQLQRLRASPPVDVRQILYGRALAEFIVRECVTVRDRAARGSTEEDQNDQEPRKPAPSSFSAAEQPEDDDCEPVDESPIPEIHESWLLSPRADLRDKAPREVILEKFDFINCDLEYRAQQWSLLGEGPPPLPRTSAAYLFAGFGMHEYVVYYYLVRHLVRACWNQIQSGEQIDVRTEAGRLEEIRDAWLGEPLEEFDGRVPSALIESERRRIPIVLSASDLVIDEDCELCQMMGAEANWEHLGPGFWYLDGCNMDDGYAFSTCLRLEEWEEEQRSQRELREEFERTWAIENRGSVGEGDLPTGDRDDEDRTEWS